MAAKLKPAETSFLFGMVAPALAQLFDGSKKPSAELPTTPSSSPPPREKEYKYERLVKRKTLPETSGPKVKYPIDLQLDFPVKKDCEKDSPMSIPLHVTDYADLKMCVVLAQIGSYEKEDVSIKYKSSEDKKGFNLTITLNRVHTLSVESVESKRYKVLYDELPKLPSKERTIYLPYMMNDTPPIAKVENKMLKITIPYTVPEEIPEVAIPIS